MNIAEKVGEQIKLHKEIQGISTEKLVEMLGYSSKAKAIITTIENGKNSGGIVFKTYEKILDALNLTIEIKRK